MTHKLSRYLVPVVSFPWRWVERAAYWAGTLHQRERLRLLRGMREVQGLMQLLMKQRNGYRWTKEERRQIRSELRRFVLLSPYLVLFFMPGGFFALPLLAWWLDRRAQKRPQAEASPGSEPTSS